MNEFELRVENDCGQDIHAREIRILQVNTGFLCNLRCAHCHLSCGPDRTEMMDWKTMQDVIRAAEIVQPEMVDITGGSPELHPLFRRFVSGLRERKVAVQTRTNLTALIQAGLEETTQFLQEYGVHIVASLPCYMEDNVCAQRGEGTYGKSIRVLQRLNSLDYGRKPHLPLHLVYNPGGPFLPPDQSQLEKDYKRELFNLFGITFTGLFTITNMPIGRFWDGLEKEDRAMEYLETLLHGFNCQTVDELMCRHQVSVGWDGTLYDCDFNLALGLPVQKSLPAHISDFDPDKLANRKVVTGRHCFGCTAGFGSSCGGALAPS